MSDLRFGLMLMLFGMGLVFIILALLWGVIVIFQRIDRRLLAEIEAEPSPPAARAPTADIPPDLMAAILVALQRYRSEETAPIRGRRPKHLEPTQARWVAVGRAYQLRSNIAPRRRRS